MLAVASPIPLTSPTNFSRSSKDKDGPPQHTRGSGLDAILKDAVEFVEGSSTGALVQTESKYPYINDDNPSTPAPISSPKPSPVAPTSSQASQQSLYDLPFVTSWIASREPKAGFINTGNTCFLNSVLQCLIHTTPLQRVLHQHGSQESKCRVVGAFCMICNLRTVMVQSFQRTLPFVPNPVVKNLRNIAKHMYHGRQEDAHEFLRYTVDALQHACLAGHSQKIEPKLAETTWVHKLFGGRLRSRVVCKSCVHPSDTFDAILDLSLDIHNVGSLRQALAKFVQVDFLRGANKYKCEHCKRHVNAEKQFTVHDAPICLTVHLKRFTPMGRKLGHIVEYAHTLDLQPAMSEGQHGPRYSLYGVISHAGSGPNSGHYYAHLKGPRGTWYEANDESVENCSASSVVGRKSAYMLFYMRQPEDVLGEAIGVRGASSRKNKMKRKMTIESDDEDRGVPENEVKSSPSGPRHGTELAGSRPSTPVVAIPVRPDRPDPQAIALRAKIAKVEAAFESAASKPSLVPYSSDVEEEEEGEVRGADIETRENSSPDASGIPSPPSSFAAAPRTSSPVPVPSFYGSVTKKRKSFDGSDESGGEAKRHQSSPAAEGKRVPRHILGTPFTASNMTNNLHASRDKPEDEFHPPYRNHKQRIAGVGGIGSFHPTRKGITARMKPRILM